GPPRPRRGGEGGPGGRDDGRRRGGGRTIGLALLFVVVLVVLVLGGTIVTFWTDAIWFRSVGYDAVFWTRVLTQLGLFGGTFVVALVILLGNLWIAGRALPPSQGARVGIREFFERMADSTGGFEGRRTEGRGAAGRGSA